MILLAVLASAAPAGCRKDDPKARIAATNSYLACAAGEFLPPGEQVLRLAPPGMCPGHFDLKPSHITCLRGCKVLLRFDFEAGLERRLAGLRRYGLSIVSVVPGQGLVIPRSYLRTCRQVADALAMAGLADRSFLQRRLGQIERRLARLDRRARARLGEAKLTGAAVLASRHQAAFCEYLGLKVVRTFSAGDSTRTGQIQHCLASARAEPAGIRCVIGNQQEGSAAARGLAEHLDRPVVMFSNFPAMTDDQHGFDALVRANVAALVKVR